MDRIQVVHCSQDGGPAGPVSSAGRAGAAVRPGAGRPFPARPSRERASLGRLPWRWVAAGALVPGLGAAVARPGGRAGLARCHHSPLCTAVTAGEVHTLAGWLFVILQMAPVM
jgi:hypothetical protein